MHGNAYSFVASLVEKTRPLMNMQTATRPEGPLHGVDLGGRNNDLTRAIWRNVGIDVIWTVVDIQSGDDVTIVSDAALWSPDKPYDIVLCTEVLEHSDEWRYIVHTAMHALAPNGHLILTCAGPGRTPHNMTDGGPLPDGEHYDNILPQSLAEQFVRGGKIGWRTLTYDPVSGDVYAYMQRLWPNNTDGKSLRTRRRTMTGTFGE